MWMELQGALGHSSHEQNAQEKEEVDVEVQYVVTCIDPLLELLLAANKQRDNCEVDENQCIHSRAVPDSNSSGLVEQREESTTEQVQVEEKWLGMRLQDLASSMLFSVRVKRPPTPEYEIDAMYHLAREVPAGTSGAGMLSDGTGGEQEDGAHAVKGTDGCFCVGDLIRLDFRVRAFGNTDASRAPARQLVYSVSVAKEGGFLLAGKTQGSLTPLCCELHSSSSHAAQWEVSLTFAELSPIPHPPTCAVATFVSNEDG